MKLKHSNRQYESTVTGKKMKMGFAADAAQHLAELMSNSVYQDKYGSIVREVVSNAIDANKESGSTNKVVVAIEEKPSMSDGVGYLTVQDSGPGISPERIENIFTQYFASTKRDTNEQIGGFGIGAKSPFAYTPVFSVITHVDGVKRTYLMEKSSAERTCTLVSETDCSYADNGTTIRIPINTTDDEYRFVTAIKEQLVLLADRLVIMVPDKHDFVMPRVLDLGDILLIENESGGLVEHDGTMISLGDVLYKIPGEGYGEYRNYVLKFNIGELSPTLSREGIELNDDAKVLIRNRHCDVTAAAEQWREDQAVPTTNIRHLTRMRDRTVCFPGTDHEVRFGRNSYHHWTVKTIGDGWPGRLNMERFNMLVSQSLNPSARYHQKSGKWRSPNVISLIRDVVQDDGYDKYLPVVKPANTNISSVWKEYYGDIHEGPRNVALISISTNIDALIRDIWRRDLANLLDDQVDKIVQEATEFYVTSLNQWITDHCVRYKDVQPPAEWLEARKEAMKARRGAGRTGKWTADMLKEKMPVKVHQPHGGRHREEWTIKDLKKPGVCIMQNRYIKDYPLLNEYVQPVTIVIVSDGNFKRLQKAGAHCWTKEDLHKIWTRRSRQSIELAISKQVDTYRKDIDRAAWRLLMVSEHPWVYQPKSKTKKLICFHDLKYRDWCNEEQVTIDGQVFSKKKLEAQSRNLRKIMNRTVCGKLLAATWDHHESRDDSQKYIHQLLNPQQNG